MQRSRCEHFPIFFIETKSEEGVKENACKGRSERSSNAMWGYERDDIASSNTRKVTILTGIDLKTVGPIPAVNVCIPPERYELMNVERVVRKGRGMDDNLS